MKRLFPGFCLAAGLLLAAAGCEKYEETPAVFNPEATGAAAPMITRVEPEGAAFAGLTEIRIIGDNFSPVPSDNVVYFDNKAGTVKAASKTELRVIPPNYIKDNVTIKVAVAGAFNLAQISPYALKAVSIDYGGFINLDQVFSIAVDANEVLYAHLKTGAQVIKVLPDGTKIPFGTTSSFPKAAEMKIGPGGELYLQRSASGNLYRIGTGGGDATVFVALPNRTASFDFDANLNLFAAGNKSGMYAVSPSGAITTTGKYTAFDVKSVRVFNGHVYVAALYTGTVPSIPKAGVWRSRILSAAGELGDEELVFDWAAAGAPASVRFNALTFAEDGDMYLGTNGTDPILVVHPNGSAEPLYPGVLKPESLVMSWGTGNYLYVNRDNAVLDLRRVVRIDMAKKGAPYYGRD